MKNKNAVVKSILYASLFFLAYLGVCQLVHQYLHYKIISLHALSSIVENQFLSSAYLRLYTFLATLGLYLLWIKLDDTNFPRNNVFFPKTSTLKYYLIGLGMMATALLAAYLLNIYFGVVKVHQIVMPPGYILADFVIVFILSTFTAATEELVFRGYILDRLSYGINPHIACFVQAMLFGLMHYNNAPGVSIILLIGLAGLLFGYVFLAYRNIYVNIAMHTTLHLANLLYSNKIFDLKVGFSSNPLFSLFSADFGFFNFLGITILLIGVFYYNKLWRLHRYKYI